MTVRMLLLAVASWLAAPAAYGLDLSCPDGAKDSGYAKHQRTRGCILHVGGRSWLHGPLMRWHGNGRLATKESFVRGVREGEFTSWWESGRLRSTGSYAGGEPAGSWTFWDEAGRVTSTVTYTERGAIREDFYPSGKPRATGTLREDGKVDWWKLYDQDGSERARCDFGEGLLTAPVDPDCRLIAEEVEPRGFAPPRAKGEVDEEGTATIALGSQSYAFTTPPGWVADAAAGLSEGLALVFVPTGTAWRESGRNMSVRAVPKYGQSLQNLIDEDRARTAQRLGEYEGALPPRRCPLGRVEAKILGYTWVEHPESPAIPGRTKQMREAVAYVDASPEVALVVTLVCDHPTKMRDALPAFLALIESPRAVATPLAPTPAGSRSPSVGVFPDTAGPETQARSAVGR